MRSASASALSEADMAMSGTLSASGLWRRAAARRQTVDRRHHQVYQNHVGTLILNDVQRRLQRGMGDDRGMSVKLQDVDQELGHSGLVVSTRIKCAFLSIGRRRYGMAATAYSTFERAASPHSHLMGKLADCQYVSWPKYKFRPMVPHIPDPPDMYQTLRIRVHPCKAPRTRDFAFLYRLHCVAASSTGRAMTRPRHHKGFHHLAPSLPKEGISRRYTSQPGPNISTGRREGGRWERPEVAAGPHAMMRGFPLNN